MIWLWLMGQLPLLSDGENELSQNRSSYTRASVFAVESLISLHLGKVFLCAYIPTVSNLPTTVIIAFYSSLWNSIRSIILPWSALEKDFSYVLLHAVWVKDNNIENQSPSNGLLTESFTSRFKFPLYFWLELFVSLLAFYLCINKANTLCIELNKYNYCVVQKM